jgi:hypothetical protein
VKFRPRCGRPVQIGTVVKIRKKNCRHVSMPRIEIGIGGESNTQACAEIQTILTIQEYRFAPISTAEDISPQGSRSELVVFQASFDRKSASPHSTNLPRFPVPFSVAFWCARRGERLLLLSTLATPPFRSRLFAIGNRKSKIASVAVPVVSTDTFDKNFLAVGAPFT